MAKDKEYNKLIHKNRWLKLRKAKLTANPICERCKEKPAKEVHHIKPVEDGMTQREKHNLMYDFSNLQSLCHDCHVLTHTEMGRSGKAHAKRRAKDQLQGFCEKFIFLQIFAQMLNGAMIF